MGSKTGGFITGEFINLGLQIFQLKNVLITIN